MKYIRGPWAWLVMFQDVPTGLKTEVVVHADSSVEAATLAETWAQDNKTGDWLVSSIRFLSAVSIIEE